MENRLHGFRRGEGRDELIGGELRRVADRLGGSSMSPLLTYLVETGELSDRRDLGYRVIGIVKSDASSSTASDLGADVIGNFDELASLIRDLEIQEVIITDNTIPSDRLFEAMMNVGRK